MTAPDSQLATLLAAARDEPDDDLPRLALADWLEERGDPRGEFIHLQCALARMDEADPRHQAFSAREQELLARHAEEWLGPLRGVVLEPTFRRGFLEEVVETATYLAVAAVPWRTLWIGMPST